MAEQDHCRELLLENQLCFALHSTSLLMTKVYKPFLKALGLTYPQYLAMLVLWESDGITVGEMSKRLLTDSGSLTPLLKRLEADGLLKRVRRQADERVVELHLTETGQAMRDRASDIPACIVKASDRDVDSLVALKEDLLKLRKSLQDAL
ncbi:MarR family transcriptional regulator [Marinobacter sp. NFXS9]|uniref:MarR family winged helix-turn-helix transcriptional regulator n=1 Tax=Marinobacter sp. NFXS9 TaxID=2818433 RepID=UPI0032DF6F3D